MRLLAFQMIFLVGGVNHLKNIRQIGSFPQVGSNGGFLKWWYPTTMGFPTKNDHFGVFWGTAI